MVMISDLKITIDAKVVEDQDIKAGDVVEIKSGGPRMVVSRIAEGVFESVVVTWFHEGCGEHRDEILPVVCLKKHAD